MMRLKKKSVAARRGDKWEEQRLSFEKKRGSAMARKKLNMTKALAG